MTEADKLTAELRRLDFALRLWGIDNYLGFRTEQTLRLSAQGATNLVALVDKLTDEVARLSVIVGNLAVEA